LKKWASKKRGGNMLFDKSIKILVAEDDYLISEEIIRSLRLQGYTNILEVLTASWQRDIIFM
jgi:hypothetical protein